MYSEQSEESGPLDSDASGTEGDESQRQRDFSSSHGFTGTLLGMQAGSVDAWKEFAIACVTWLIPKLQRMGVERQETEDVAHDVVIRIKKRVELFEPSKGSAKAWIRQIAKNIWFDKLRKRKTASKHKEHLAISEAEVVREFDLIADREVLAIALTNTERHVPAVAYEKFLRFKLREQSTQKIARDMDCSITAVHTAVFRVNRVFKAEVIKLQGPER